MTWHYLFMNVQWAHVSLRKTTANGPLLRHRYRGRSVFTTCTSQSSFLSSCLLIVPSGHISGVTALICTVTLMLWANVSKDCWDRQRSQLSSLGYLILALLTDSPGWLWVLGWLLMGTFPTRTYKCGKLPNVSVLPSKPNKICRLKKQSAFWRAQRSYILSHMRENTCTSVTFWAQGHPDHLKQVGFIKSSRLDYGGTGWITAIMSGHIIQCLSG